MEARITTMPFQIEKLRHGYRKGLRPETVIGEASRRREETGDGGIFIHTDRDAALAAAAALGACDGRPPWGIPLAVKVNIDVPGMPTPAVRPDFYYRTHRAAL